MDGPTATKEIRALGYTGRVLGVTGNGMPSDKQHFLAHGADDILVKPLTYAHFMDSMRRHH